ncbi:MAG: ribosome silencing factor [Pseudomonadota bacterium]
MDFVLAGLEDGKAEDILTIDLKGKSSFADAMIIASGRSNRQVAALADRLTRDAKDIGLGRLSVEGLPQADWVLIDFGELIVHLFRPEVRTFYNLEKMWAQPQEPAAVS